MGPHTRQTEIIIVLCENNIEQREIMIEHILLDGIKKYPHSNTTLQLIMQTMLMCVKFVI